MQCCARCGREVHSAEQKVACNKVWHAFCFSCFKCGKLLDVCTINTFEGEIYCRSCYSHICRSRDPCSRPVACDTACNPRYTACASCEQLCLPHNPCRTICNRCYSENCQPQEVVTLCNSCVSDTQCSKAACTCSDEFGPPTRMHRCKGPGSYKPGRCGQGSCCPGRPAVPVPREVANYYNRNHDNACENCCQSPCATVECTPPKSCCLRSNSCPPSKCYQPKCATPIKCCSPIKCSPPAECLSPIKCSLPSKCCPPNRCFTPQRCYPGPKACPPANCCPSNKYKCGPSKCCPPKPSCSVDPCCSADPCSPCLSDPCCAQRRPCSGKSVCYPPVKCCDPTPEEIICFHPSNGFPKPRCSCPKAQFSSSKCDTESRRRMAIYCNTPSCRRCGHKVYAAEKVQIAGSVFHSCCFTCCCCNKPLDVCNAYENQGEIHCKTCYCKYFGIQGYGYGATLQVCD